MMEALQETGTSGGELAAGSFNPQDPPAAVTTELSPAISQRKSWPAVEWLPIQLSVALPIFRFCVRDLLSLDPGQTIATAWPSGEDLPLSIEDVQLAWAEIEAVDQAMAIRITRLL